MTADKTNDKDAFQKKLLDWVIASVAIAMFAYHMLFTQIVWQSSFQHEATHLCFALVIIYLSLLRTRGYWARVGCILLILISVICSAYIIIRSDYIEDLMGFAPPLDFTIGSLLLVCVLIGTYLEWGAIITGVALVFLSYSLWGHEIPGILNHLYIPANQVMSYLILSTQGAFGSYLLSSADYIFLFVVFGALLSTVGAHQFFIQVGQLVSKRVAGGSGQTTIVSSSLVAMVTGIVMASVAITGAFTIPAMKRDGYTPEQAGGIEAVAGTGGQITPPVMGMGAFIMVVVTGISYVDICAAAIIPAIMYYLICLLGVRALAIKVGITARNTKPTDWKEFLKSAPMFIVPVGVLIYLLVNRYSVMNTGFWVVVTIIVVGLVRKKTRPSLRQLINGITEGATIGASVAVVCGTIGVITQGMTMTGLGGKISGLIILASHGALPLILLMVAVIALILGCGMPTPAAYALVAALGGPVLIKAGMSVLSAHMFILFYAILSAVTPPVATGCLVGARMAGADFWKTSWVAVKLSFPLFIIPILWVYNDTILGNFSHHTMIEVVATLSMALLGLLSALPAIQGIAINRIKFWERCIYAITAILFFRYVIEPDSPMLIVSLIMFTCLAIWEWIKFKRTTKNTRTLAEA